MLFQKICRVTTSYLMLTILLVSSYSLNCPKGLVQAANGCISPQYIEGCIHYDNQSNCSQCCHNYILKDSRCQFQEPQPGSCFDFDYNGECKKCQDGLFLDLKSKECLDIKIAGCLELGKDQPQCINCGKNFQLVNGTCIPHIRGCTKYQLSPQNPEIYSCNECEPNYDLIDGECGQTSWGQIVQSECMSPFQRVNGECLVLNCQHAFEWGCLQCEEGFDLNAEYRCVRRTMPGCIDYETSGKCRMCQDAFYTKLNGICYPFGCQQLNQNFQCVKCKSPFSLLQGHCGIQNCAYHGPLGCDICQSGTQFIGGRCELCREKQAVCVSCPVTHFVNQAQECQRKQEGCILYKYGECTQCSYDYFLDSSLKRCVKKLPGCIYHLGSSKCSDCRDYFLYDADKEICILPGCRQYSNEGVCVNCYDIFRLSQQGRCYIPNCLQYSQQACLKCEQGFQLDEKGKCTVFDPNCIARNIYKSCIGCKEGFYLSRQETCTRAKLGCNYIDGICTSCKTPFTYHSTTTTCIIDGCKVYFFGGCEQCHDQLGYSLRYNSCKLPHCLISQNGKCLECDPNYIMRKATNQCINKDEFCYEYNSEGQCIECAPKYFMSKLQHRCLQRKPGCVYNSQDQCSSCTESFKFVPGQHRCYIVGCLEHKIDGCKKCEYPFNLTQDGHCQIKNCILNDDRKCLKCQGGYLLEKGLCTIGDEKCTEYNFTSGQCLRCKQGYKVIDNRCQYGDSHCAEFTSQGHCANCQSLYFLNPLKQCEMRDSNCQEYINGYCTRCKSYHYYFNSLCYQNSQGCLTQLNIDQCQQCEDGFELRDGKCHKAIKRLSWNDFDMGWSSFGRESQEKDLFTVGKKNKEGLQACFKSGYGKILLSSAVTRTTDVSLDSDKGWQPLGDIGEFVGVETPQKETFYALDIKCLSENRMTSFTIQYSEDLRFFRRANSVDLTCNDVGEVKTIYFTPVEALAIRIRVRRGKPHIAIEFFFNNKNYTQSTSSKQPSVIQKTIRESIASSHELLAQKCKDKELCWFGLELCEPRQILGFSIQNTAPESLIEKVYVEYSVDGVSFICFMECREYDVKGLDRVDFKKPVFGSKMRVHVASYQGEPKIKVSFNYE